ncbi:MAG: hypothetical protein ACFE9W_04765 [Promethearchaeota archaeon]
MSGRWKEVTHYYSGYSGRRSSRALDHLMILCCAMFVIALCAPSYRAAAQNPNLLEQMEGHFGELSNNAVSWSMYPATDTDNLAQDEFDIGLRSESASWVLQPEDGYIEIDKAVLPQGDIQLCIDQDYLDQFFVYVHVYGGYTVDPEKVCLVFEQKDEWHCVDVVVTKVDGLCCSDYYYNFTLRLKDGIPFCFDANNFPDDSIFLPFEIKHGAYPDLEKEINAYFCSTWSGCHLEAQEFQISLVHSNIRFEPSVTFSNIK